MTKPLLAAADASGVVCGELKATMMNDAARKIEHAVDGNASVKKRPHRQGKPLRKRAKRLALPDGRFRFSDEQWREVSERFGFPSDARYRMEITITIFRNNLAEEADAVPPSMTRQHLRQLAKTTKSFFVDFQSAINDSRASELLTRQPDCQALRLCRLEQDLRGLSESLTIAANAVQLGPPGAGLDWNIFGIVNALAALWEKHTGKQFNRSKTRPNATDFVIAVGRIADPGVHRDTWENVLRSVAANRFWENSHFIPLLNLPAIDS